MHASLETNFIIVGQGLAGSVLAMQLRHAGKQVVVIGKEENHSSRVAAGLFNPITGKVLSKTWMADEVFSQLHQFYLQAEKTTGCSFFHSVPIYRPFLSIEEQNDWMGKSAEPTWTPFIQKVFTASAGFAEVRDDLGGLLLQQTGYLDTHAFLTAIKTLLQKENQLIEGAFEHSHLRILEHHIEYKNLKAEKIIFCEGVEALSNPFFRWLPIRPLKGETLTVQAELPKNVIINRGVYAVPEGGGTFRVGATYETQNLSPETTEKGKAELVEKFQEIFSSSFTILRQDWGVRPTSADRRPIIGEHPAHNRVLVCNGLGTKGVSLAPFSGSLLTQFLVYGTRSATYAALDVNRYNSLYWKALQNP